MKTFFVWLFRLAIVGAIVVLCVINRDMMTLNFFPLPYEITLPKFLFGLCAFTGGILVGTFIGSLRLFRARQLQKQHERRNAALENELSSLRTEKRHTPAVTTPLISSSAL